ncbi:13430_t:CDS:1, partial [Acaulospora colombiana]
TANVFGFAIYYLAHYPDVKDRLRQEIDLFFNQNQNRSLTYDDLSNLIYCEAVIKEVSRVMTTIPFISRYSSEPDVIENIQWDADTHFLIFTPGIHLNDNYWKGPENFNADRFINIDVQKQQQNNLIMWGGGLRMCP